MKRTLTVLAFSITGVVVFAQQDPQFSQYMFNQLEYNPAYAGTSKAICATALFRDQWVSFPGAPKTGLLSVDAYIPKIFGGLGLTVMNDQIGFQQTNYAKLAYSYHLPIGPGILGIGLEGGILQESINGNWIAPDGTTTAANNITDQSIPKGAVSKTIFDVGGGLYYTTEKLYAGISSTHLPEQDITNLNYTVARTYYFLAGYDYSLSPSWDLKPSILVKSVASPTQMDVSMLAQWERKFYFGVSYRITDAVVALVGLNYTLANGSNLRIGYSYDVTTSALNVQSKGTQEILLKYCFKIEPPVKKQYHENVRFMR